MGDIPSKEGPPDPTDELIRAVTQANTVPTVRALFAAGASPNAYGMMAFRWLCKRRYLQNDVILLFLQHPHIDIAYISEQRLFMKAVFASDPNTARFYQILVCHGVSLGHLTPDNRWSQMNPATTACIMHAQLHTPFELCIMAEEPDWVRSKLETGHWSPQSLRLARGLAEGATRTLVEDSAAPWSVDRHYARSRAARRTIAWIVAMAYKSEFLLPAEMWAYVFKFI